MSASSTPTTTAGRSSGAAPGSRAPEPRSSGTADPWAGTSDLLRLFLRLDRVRIAIWTVSFGIIVAGSVASLDATYTTPESLQARAAFMSNPSAVMMTGPAFGLDNYTFGAMLANELSLWLFIASAIMSILLVVRHTRAEEESGRLEVVRALPVGRFAPAVAAIITVALANLAVGAATTVALVGTGQETASSIAIGVATALTGLVFGAVGGITAQLTEHARAASSMALGALALAFLVRGLGDVIDNQGSWLSWLSPLAWAQQTKLYVDLRWWPLALSVAAVVGLLATTVVLAQRRDLGAGLRAPRPGPAQASPRLLSNVGLAHRLLWNVALGWTIGMVFFAIAFGALANSLEDVMQDIPQIGEWIAIDLADLTTSFAAAMLSFLVIAPIAIGVAGVVRLRSEEAAGRAEAVLVTGSSRPALLGGWTVVVAAQATAMLLLIGLGVGLGMAAGTGESHWIWDLTVASLAYLPATLLMIAAAVALYGLIPRLAALAWALVVWVTIALYLGGMLGLPDWAMSLSPVYHTPLVPGADVDAAPLVVMSGLALALAAAGFVGFRRRDVVPGE
ncbi:polyketide antibiotic transporter [Intrasporangium sp.]|uniref:ABC transporter permease n=1 Tax=Intrasporangium sp. TaxID=1925024 RepID=UPI00293A7BAB|nr:polyketide antibiotic transporter [Intrasporangium sp.]MDV3222642.1 polyketide antibiotic transporter [Intrasporangium sp.]